MGRHAHRRAPGDERGTASSAWDRARVRWGVERTVRLHGSHDDQTVLARHLQRHLRHLPVVMLHDLLVADGSIVVEHLAIGPGGVTVIHGADPLAGPLRVERRHGVFGARDDRLLDGAAADRTAILEPVLARMDGLASVVDGITGIAGALCLPASEPPLSGLPVHVGDVLVGEPRAVAALAARCGDLSDTALGALVERVRTCCPPAPRRRG